MPINRLDLDFSIQLQEERAKFIEDYLKLEMFTRIPPSPQELDTMSNYILWGKDEDTGLNPNQTGDIELPSRKKTWAKNKNVESLDALIMQPGFKESSIMTNSAPTRVKKQNFSRQTAREQAPPDVLREYELLWRQIDELELLLNFYEFQTGKRKNAPRDELLSKFSSDAQLQVLERACGLKYHQYLKSRHLLVELRRTQFTIKDGYAAARVKTTVSAPDTPSALVIGSDFAVAPLGLKYKEPIYDKIFSIDKPVAPNLFYQSERPRIEKILWDASLNSNDIFDFQNTDHVCRAIYFYQELRDQCFDADVHSNVDVFLDTLEFYIHYARLSPIYTDILNLKKQRLTNQQIADVVNQRYGKTYNSNYISTIYRQKIAAAIANGARAHRDVVELLFDPGSFKKCAVCGEILLLNSDNFVKKTKSKDGFTNRCKRCDKKQRSKNKQ